MKKDEKRNKIAVALMSRQMEMLLNKKVPKSEYLLDIMKRVSIPELLFLSYIGCLATGEEFQKLILLSAQSSVIDTLEKCDNWEEVLSDGCDIMINSMFQKENA